MAIPSTPTTFVVQSGNGLATLSWDQMAGSTSYLIQRSQDNITFAPVVTLTGSPLANSYTDSTVTPGLQYYYQVAAANGSGTSAYTVSQSTIVENLGLTSLASIRLQAQQRCDRVNSQFILTTEWNSYATQSYKELFDLLAQKFGDDYFEANPYTYTTVQNQNLYPLPIDFYKLLGVEVALNPADPNSWVSLRKFEFVQRNLWNYPNVYTFYGVTNLRYRLNGNNLYVVPIPSAGQTLRIWYVPRPQVLMLDTDTVDGVSGWEEYIIVDMCIKALNKEESDTSVFMAQKAALKQRIEEAAENRDIGSPETVSDTRKMNFAWGDGQEGNGFGGYG